MLRFLRTLTIKDISTARLGKMRRYRFKRGDTDVVLTGMLMSFYYEEKKHSGPVYGSTYVDTVAILKTRKGQYVVYYILVHQDGEEREGRHEYVKVLRNFQELERFVAHMQYANSPHFYPEIIKEASRNDG